MKKEIINIFELSDKLPFGKYKDETLFNIIMTDIQYIEWCLNNIKQFKIDENANKKYKDVLLERTKYLTQERIEKYNKEQSNNTSKPNYKLNWGDDDNDNYEDSSPFNSDWEKRHGLIKKQ